MQSSDQQQPFYGGMNLSGSPQETSFYPVDGGASQPGELGQWTYPQSPAQGGQARSPAEYGAVRGRTRAATLAGRGKSTRSRGMTDELVSGSMSGLDIQHQDGVSSLGSRPSRGHAHHPSLDQQVNSNWQPPTPSRLPLPPQWQPPQQQQSPYAHQRYPSQHTPARTLSHPRHQHHRSLSTNGSSWNAGHSPASHSTMFAYRSTPNAPDLLPSPAGSPQAGLRGSLSSSSLYLEASYGQGGLTASSSTNTLDGQAAGLAVNDGNGWTTHFPRNVNAEFASAVAGQHHQYQAPSLSPSVSSSHSYANGLPHTPSSASFSSYRGFSGAPTSPSGYSTYSAYSNSNSTTSSSSFQVPKRARQPSQGTSAAAAAGSASRQTYASQTPAQKHPHKNHSRARSSPSPSTFASTRTSSGPEMATGECMKRPEVVAAITRLKKANQSPFAPNSGFPFVIGPIGSDKLKMKLTAEQKYEMCTLYNEFPGQKQETIGKCYGLERSTISKILKDKRRWLATDATEYAASQQKEGSKNGSPLKPTTKPTRFTEVETPLLEWVEQFADVNGGRSPSDDEIRQRAFGIVIELGWKSDRFRGSSGWLDAFRARNNLPNPRNQTDGSDGSPSAESVADKETPSFGLDGLVTWDDARSPSDENDESAPPDAFDHNGDESVSSATGRASMGEARGWERSLSGRSTSSSSSFGGRREPAVLPAVLEDETQHVRTRTFTRGQMSRMDSSSSSQALSSSTTDSPASSSTGGLRTPDLSVEPDASQQVTPTNQHRAALRSAHRAQQLGASSTFPAPATPSVATVHQTYAYPTSLEGSAPYQGTPASSTNFAPDLSSAYGEDGYPVDPYESGLVEPMPVGWGQETLVSDYDAQAYGGESEGLVYAPVDHATPMDYSMTVPGEFGLFPTSTEQGTMDPSTFAYTQPQQQLDAEDVYGQGPQSTHMLPPYDSSMGSRSVSSSSASTSASSASFPLSPHSFGSQWHESPTVPDYTSPNGAFISSPPGTDFLLAAPPAQKQSAATAALLPPFAQQQQQQHPGARTRSYTSSSLSQAFPPAEQAEAMQARQRMPAQSQQKKISDEDGKVAIEMARRYLAQNKETSSPDALEVALGRVTSIDELQSDLHL